MPGPIRSSNLVKEPAQQTSTVTAATISGVAAGNALVAIVVAYRPSTASGNLVDAYETTIGGVAANTWTEILRVGYSAPGSAHRTELTMWVAPNAAAGTTAGKPNFTYEDASTNIFHHMDEWVGVATSSPKDKSSTGTVPSNSASIPSGSTGTLSQAAQIAIGAVANRYNFSWGGNYSSPGTPPSGFTILQGDTANSNIAAQSFYQEVSATTALSFTQTQENQGDQGAVAGLVTLKLSTTQYRVEVTGINSDVNGKTGITAFVWTANPKDVKATEYTGVTAEATGGKIFLAPAPAGTVENQVVNVAAYQPGGTQGLVAITTGTVKAY